MTATFSKALDMAPECPPITSIGLDGVSGGSPQCCGYLAELQLGGSDNCPPSVFVATFSACTNQPWVLQIPGQSWTGGQTASMCASGTTTLQPAAGNAPFAPYNQPVTISWAQT